MGFSTVFLGLAGPLRSGSSKPDMTAWTGRYRLRSKEVKDILGCRTGWRGGWASPFCKFAQEVRHYTKVIGSAEKGADAALQCQSEGTGRQEQVLPEGTSQTENSPGTLKEIFVHFYHLILKSRRIGAMLIGNSLGQYTLCMLTFGRRERTPPCFFQSLAAQNPCDLITKNLNQAKR